MMCLEQHSFLAMRHCDKEHVLVAIDATLGRGHVRGGFMSGEPRQKLEATQLEIEPEGEKIKNKIKSSLETVELMR